MTMLAAPPRVVEPTMLQKLLKYGAVSLVVTPVSLILLTIFFNVFGWTELVSNLLAVSISSVPSYFLNRAWVWQKDGVISMRYEVIPFWLMALLGLVISTALVAWVSSRFDFVGAVQLANLSGFLVLWFAKFLVLDRILFAKPAVEDG